MKTKIQLLEKVVTRPNELVRIAEDLDYKYKHLKGIAVLHNIGDTHLLRSCIIDSIEVFPKNFEVAFLQTNAHVAPKDRFFPLHEVADGKKIEIEYQDVFNSGVLDGGLGDDSSLGNIPVSGSNSYPYTLKIYLLLSHE